MTVDVYIAAQPDAVHAPLRTVRAALRAALPNAVEAISYNIPTYKIGGKAVIYFAGWKEHYSVYPVSEAIKAACQSELAAYEVGKGTIRFPLSAPVPVELIQKIATLRAAEVASRKPRSRPAAK